MVAALSRTPSALGVACSIAPHPSSEAEKAYLNGKYDDAARLYQQQLAQQPNDPGLTAGLVRVLLDQQNVQDADDLVQKALKQSPNSAVLLTSLGTVQYREGTPWLSIATASQAMKIDPCYPRLRLLNARLARISSKYAAAAKELAAAHALDPQDPEISERWIDTLPLKQRIAQLEAYLAASAGADPDRMNDLRSHIEDLRKEDSGPHKACRMVSDIATT